MLHTRKVLSSVILAGLALVLLLGALPAQAAPPNLRPAITPGPLNHREELRATVNARAKLAHVELRIDTRKVQPWVKAHAGLKYTIRYPLTKLAVGTHTARLTVRDQKNRSTQRQWQFQKLAQLGLTADKTGIQLGERVTLSVQGFTPGTVISLSLGGATTGASGNYGAAVIDANGRFGLAVTPERDPNGLPLQAGPILLVAHNASWTEQASAPLQIVTLTAAPTTIQPGDPITLRGEGFVPGSTMILSLASNGAAAAGSFGSAAVDASGRFVLTTTLTQNPNGSPLQPGPLVLVVHDPSWSQRAAVQIQVVDRVPAAPRDLRLTSLTKGATSAEPTVAGLQWRDNAANEAGFRIQATFTRLNGGTDAQVWTLPANATTAKVSFVAGGINPVTTACFTVTAFNSQGSSSPSNEVCAAL